MSKPAEVLTVGELIEALQMFDKSEKVFINISCDEAEEVYPVMDVSTVTSPCIILCSEELIRLEDDETGGEE